MLLSLKKDLEKLGDPKKAEVLQRFFKTGKGEYGEGDVFLGVKVPESRAVARKYSGLSPKNIETLLESKVHEHRLTALLILVHRFETHPAERKQIFSFYLDSLRHVNNWDLVDLSAHQIVGRYLLENPREKQVLFRLAKSSNLWARRVAIVSTYAFIREDQFDLTLEISELLLNDRHDLIQKAVGWMLRELGKRNQEEEEGFLVMHHRQMPRTMLRYALERFPKEKRDFYMAK